MELAISNIAWSAKWDEQVYNLMKQYHFTGLEIAPTRIFPENPYDDLERAKKWRDGMRHEYGFTVPSMQSIWFGVQEKIFGSSEDRKKLLAYTKKAIDFAVALECHNLVFGCPRNRNVTEGADMSLGVMFFQELGEYALERGTIIGMEANPPIYNTNYINDTMAAVELIRQVGSQGFQLNLDIGTMIQNEEKIGELTDMVPLINHIHISEPQLKPIQKREMHRQLAGIMKTEGYHGYVSIEMGTQDDIILLEDTMKYIAEVFG